MAFPSTDLIRLENGNVDEENEGKGNKPGELLNPNSPQLRGSSEIEEEDDGSNTPLRYVPLCDVYSATTPCVSSASGGSKKVKPPHHHHHRKSLNHFNGRDPAAKPDKLLSPSIGAMAGVGDSNCSDNSRVNVGDRKEKPPITKFYKRRDKGKGKVQKIEKEEKKHLGFVGWDNSRSRGANLDNFNDKKEEDVGIEEENGELIAKKRKRRKFGGYELASLGVDTIALSNLDRLKFREPRHGNDANRNSSYRNSGGKDANCNPNCGKMRKRKPSADLENEIKNLRTKRWIWYLISFGLYVVLDLLDHTLLWLLLSIVWMQVEF